MKLNDPILIAGGTGLIGSACIRRLKRSGYENILYPNRTELDLFDRKKISDYLGDNSVVNIIFAAGKVGGIVENRDNPASFIDENTIIGLNGLWAAKNANVKRMIIFGSSCMYPVAAQQPFKEHSLFTGELEETSIAYATAKVATFQAALAYNRQFNNSTMFIPIIPNSTFGPNDNYDLNSSHVLAALIRKIHIAHISKSETVELWGTGKPHREFVYCDNLADACLFLLNYKFDMAPQPINISSGEEVSISQLARKIASIVSYRGEIIFDNNKPDGVMRKSLSNLSLSEMGWNNYLTLEKGLKNTYDWFVKNYE
jgi:GDP-L-fucose synthase